MTDSTALELADVIKALRQELITAQQEGEGKGIRFNVNNVEVELETVIEKKADGKGGFKIRFGVVDVNAEAGGEYKEATKQKIKLSLEAVTPNISNQPSSNNSNPRAQIHSEIEN